MSPELTAATALLQRSDLNGALTAFEAVLAHAPMDIAALAGHASALRRAGRVDDALVQWRKALDCAPDDPGLCFNHANALRAAGQLAAAEQGYQRALQLAPNLLPAWINLGVLYQDQRRFDAAEQAYAKALEIDSRQSTAAMNRGNCLRQLGRVDESIAHHRLAIEIAPRSAQAWYNLGNALREGHAADALSAYRAALQADPAPLELWTRLGVSLQDLGDSDAALRAFDRGRREHPQASQAHCNFGHMAMRLRQPREGIEALRKAVRLEPGEPVATSHLVDALIKSGFLNEAVNLAEAALRKAQAEFETSDPSYKERLSRLHNVLGNARCSAGEIGPAITHMGAAMRLLRDASSVSNLLFATLYREDLSAMDKALLHRQETADFSEFRSARARAVGAHGDPEAGTANATITPDVALAATQPAEAGRRLRIAYLSADLAEHPVGYFMQPLLRHHDRSAFEVFVYSDVESPDELTEQIRADVEHWVPICGYSDEALAQRVRSDGIEALIELSGHTAGNRLPLLAQRVAPLQLSYLGYPFSSGLAAIDAMFGDAITTPPADAALYHERLLRLPHFPFCMQPHRTAPTVAPLPALRNGHLSFGCFNNLAKIGPATLALWARLLHALPDARLLLRALGLNDAPTCERILAVMASHGIDQTRLELLPPIRPIEAYLDGYARIDIALDPLAYNGGTTSFEALWQGVPVLTLPGNGYCARMGAGINATAGLDAFTARDDAHFLSIACAWNEQRVELAELRAGLRSRLAATPLFDGARASCQASRRRFVRPRSARHRRELAASSRRQMPPHMGQVQIQIGTLGHDAGGIDHLVALVVVPLDVREVDGAGHAIDLVQLAQQAGEVRIVGDAAQIALEVTDVHRVKAQQRGEQAPVGFGEPFAAQISPARQALFQPVQRLEQWHDRLFVGRLRGRESGLVHAVVDVLVNPFVELVDFGAQRLGVEIARGGADQVECAVEHANDVGRFVAHHGRTLTIPEHRHRDPA